MSTSDSTEKPHRPVRPKPRSPWEPWTGPPYGSSQAIPRPPSTREQRIPAFLAGLVGQDAWHGSFEGRGEAKARFEYGVWNERARKKP